MLNVNQQVFVESYVQKHVMEALEGFPKFSADVGKKTLKRHSRASITCFGHNYKHPFHITASF